MVLIQLLISYTRNKAYGNFWCGAPSLSSHTVYLSRLFSLLRTDLWPFPVSLDIDIFEEKGNLFYRMLNDLGLSEICGSTCDDYKYPCPGHSSAVIPA